MATFKNFEEILAWQKARILCKKIKLLTEKPLFSKDFKLRDQILSSSGSTMDNIAEGFERATNKEFTRFLYVAKGSCAEVRSLLHVGNKIGYITQSQYIELLTLCEDISKTLSFVQATIQESVKEKCL